MDSPFIGELRLLYFNIDFRWEREACGACWLRERRTEIISSSGVCAPSDSSAVCCSGAGVIEKFSNLFQCLSPKYLFVHVDMRIKWNHSGRCAWNRPSGELQAEKRACGELASGVTTSCNLSRGELNKALLCKVSYEHAVFVLVFISVIDSYIYK